MILPPFEFGHAGCNRFPPFTSNSNNRSLAQNYSSIQSDLWRVERRGVGKLYKECSPKAWKASLNSSSSRQNWAQDHSWRYLVLLAFKRLWNMQCDSWWSLSRIRRLQEKIEKQERSGHEQQYAFCDAEKQFFHGNYTILIFPYLDIYEAILNNFNSRVRLLFASTTFIPNISQHRQ